MNDPGLLPHGIDVAGPRAEAPRAPSSTQAMRKAEEERGSYLAEREGTERSSVLRGLMILAIVVLAISLWRAGAGRAFVPGWWRQW